MDRQILRKISLALVVAMLAITGLVNVQALVADVIIEEPGEIEPVGYKWKHIANGVYHCTSTGEANCDTPSSHAW
jgi:hypothetical protein